MELLSFPPTIFCWSLSDLPASLLLKVKPEVSRLMEWLEVSSEGVHILSYTIEANDDSPGNCAEELTWFDEQLRLFLEFGKSLHSASEATS